MTYTYGGKRAGAGRKSTWFSGTIVEDTKLVRVPKNIATEVLKSAHFIDAGGLIDYSQLEKVLESSSDQLETVAESKVIEFEAVAKLKDRRLDRLRQLLDEYRSRAKGTRDWSQANKIIAELSQILEGS